MEEELVKKHERIVYKIVNKWYPPKGFDKEDLIQVGMIGLLKAIREYDPSLGYSFTTFAYSCVRAEITKFVKFYAAEKRSGEVVSFNLPIPDTDDIFLEDITSSNENVEDEALANVLISELMQYNPKLTQMRLQGYTQAEIAEQIGVSQVEVSRRLKRLRQKLPV